MFPKVDTRNVVESSEEVTISNWCSFGHSSCHHEFSVRPFRCLGMTFIVLVIVTTTKHLLPLLLSANLFWFLFNHPILGTYMGLIMSPKVSVDKNLWSLLDWNIYRLDAIPGVVSSVRTVKYL